MPHWPERTCCRCLPPGPTPPAESQHAPYKTIKSRFWPWPSGTSPENHLSCSLLARKRSPAVDWRPVAVDWSRFDDAIFDDAIIGGSRLGPASMSTRPAWVPPGQQPARREPPGKALPQPHRITAPLLSELGTHEPVKARFWPCLEPFLGRKSSSPLELFPSRSQAVESGSAIECGVLGRSG